MSSSSSDGIEILPSIERLRGSANPKQMEPGPSASEHVLPTSGNGVYVPELGRRSSSINQLTSDQRASLSNNVLYSINCYMADHRTKEAAGLTHRRGRRQPSEDIDEQFDQEVRDMGANADRSAQLASTS